MNEWFDFKKFIVNDKKRLKSKLVGLNLSIKGRIGKGNRSRNVKWNKGKIGKSSLSKYTHSMSSIINSKTGIKMLKVELCNEKV